MIFLTSLSGNGYDMPIRRITDYESAIIRITGYALGLQIISVTHSKLKEA